MIDVRMLGTLLSDAALARRKLRTSFAPDQQWRGHVRFDRLEDACSASYPDIIDSLQGITGVVSRSWSFLEWECRHVVLVTVSAAYKKPHDAGQVRR
jgi:hypothetical protein